MARHENLWSLSEEAIGEYLEAAGLCIRQRKPDGGCFGYPAALLLLAAIEAIGHFLLGVKVRVCDTQREPVKERKIAVKNPFLVLNHPCFGQELTFEQIRHLKRAYRNPLAHNGRIGEGAALWQLYDGQGPPFFVQGSRLIIEVSALHKLVARVWRDLDKGLVKSSIQRQYGGIPRG